MPASTVHEKPKFPPAVAALALGTVGLLLFFMPVLAIPLAGLGLLFAIVALVSAFWGRAADVRWAVIAIVFTLFVLVLDILITVAALDSQQPTAPSELPPPAPIPYVSPPEAPQEK